ncbi:oxygenase MpaB family protein [Nocardia sp. NBC_00403]|uniref:oxygenase MpaB family protein n=1 Tax=Nocardia sp. NBC_00403 TaxID=2975990 RepID=UPI003FA6001A
MWAHIAGSQALGIYFTRQDKDAAYQLWRYTGHLLGLSPEILPTNDRGRIIRFPRSPNRRWI